MIKKIQYIFSVGVLFPFFLYSQVGINKTELAKEVKLEVGGDVIVENPAAPNGDLSFLFRDKKTGIIKKSKSIRNKPIFIYNLKLRAGSEGGYWKSNVVSYNTGIPSDKYFAFITDATLIANKVKLPAVFGLNTKWLNNDYVDRVIPIKRAYLKERDGYFRFHGEFISTDVTTPGVTTGDDVNSYTWVINVVVFKKTHMTYINAGKYTMLGIVKGLNDDPSRQNEYRQITKEEEGTNIAVTPPNLPIPLTEDKSILSNTTPKTSTIVGIDTEDPYAELDVNGKVIIEHTKTNTINNLYPLALDNKSSILVSNTKLRKPFVFIKGKILCKGTAKGAEDWIKDFDTGITTETYNLVNTNSYLGNTKYDELREANQLKEPVSGDQKRTWAYIMGILPYIDGVRNETYYSQPAVSLLPQEDGKWHYKADYHGTSPVAGKVDKPEGSGLSGIAQFDINSFRRDFRHQFYWNFNWLAISTIFSENFGTFEDEIPKDHLENDEVPYLDINGKKYDDIIEYFIVKKEKSTP